jgi:hypothetical protein
MWCLPKPTADKHSRGNVSLGAARAGAVQPQEALAAPPDPSTLPADRLLQGVHDLDELALRRHHGVGVLVRGRRLESARGNGKQAGAAGDYRSQYRGRRRWCAMAMTSMQSGCSM